MASRQRKPSAHAEPSSEEKGPWWDKYFKFVFTNRAVKDEARKKDGIVIGRPIHRGRIDEEPDSNERFEILWKANGDYDAINADIMDWQQLKSIVTDRFVPTKAVAPMVEHVILPLQERNWHATDQEFEQMRDTAVAEAKRWQEVVKEQGKLLDQLTKDVDGKQQQAKKQQKKNAAAKKEAAAAASGGKAAKGKAAAGKAAAKPAKAVAAKPAKAAPAAAAAGKAAAAAPVKSAAKAAPAAAAAGKAAAAAPVKGTAKAGSSGAAAAAAGGSKKRPAAALALANKKQKVAAAAAAAEQDDIIIIKLPDQAIASTSEQDDSDDDDDEAAAAAVAPASASKQQKKKKQVAVKQEQSKRHKSDAGAAAAAAAEVIYKGHTGRMYPAAVACKPRDRRIGTRAYQEGEANGEYPVAAIVDEVMLPALPGAKKKHMVLPKWQGYELDVNGWEDAAGMSGLDCYKAWQQQDKPAYYTAVTKAAAANAFIAWQGKA